MYSNAYKVANGHRIETNPANTIVIPSILKEMDKSCFQIYDTIQMNVDVHTIYDIKRIDSGLGGFSFDEVESLRWGRGRNVNFAQCLPSIRA